MNKELETIIENEFDCLINDLGCLMKQEWVAEAIKEAVTKAFVLGGVSIRLEEVTCAKAEPLIIEMNKNHLVELYNFAYEQAVKTNKVDELKKIDANLNGY